MRLKDLPKAGRDWLAASFANRVAFHALSLTLGVALGIGALSYAALRGQIEASVQQGLEAQAGLVEERLRAALVEANEELETLSRNAFIVNGLVDSQGRESYLLPFLRDFRLSLPGKQDIAMALYDFKGAPVVGAGPDIAPDAVKQAVATGTSQVRTTTHQGETYLKLVQPVHFPPTHSVEGALAVRIRLAPLLAAAGAGQAEDLHLHLHAGEQVLAHAGTVQQEGMHVARALKLGAPFDTLALRLTLGSSARHVQDPLNRLTLIYIAGICILLPLVVWFAHRGARHLVAPLDRLAATAEHIAGSGTILSPPPSEGPDEAGRLAEAFGRMLARLQDAHEELEQRVLERTEALRASEMRLRTILETEPECVKVIGPDGRLRQMNPAGLAMIEADAPEQAIGQRLEELVIPEYRRAFRELILRTLQGESGRLEFKIVGLKGTHRWLETHAVPLNCGDGGETSLLAVTRDISERKRAELLNSASQHVLEMIIGRHALPEVLDRLTRDVETMTPGMLASILLLDADGVHLRHGAAPSLPEAYNRAVDGEAIGLAAGSCGAAAFRREQVIVSDIAADPLWADYRELALTHGLRACWSTPIFSPAGQVLGTFALYYREPRAPAAYHQELIRHVTTLAAVAIERIRAEEGLRERQRMLSESQRMAHIGSWEVDLASGQITWSEESYRLYGVTPDSFDHTWEAFLGLLHPDDRAAMQTWADASLARENPGDLEFRTVHPGGQIRVLSGRGTLVCDAEYRPIRMVGTVQDITERKAAEVAVLRQREELRQRNDELERFNRATVGRELDMIRLKQEINALSLQLGQAAPYSLAFLDLPVPPEGGAAE